MTRSLNYERRGRGEPLLLIHGTGSHWQAWGPVLDRLAGERDVIAVDLPGHGRSPMVDPGIVPNPAGFARVLGAFLDDLRLETVHVAGNSAGGWTGLELAKLRRARSVTALSPAGLWRNGAPLYDRVLFRTTRHLTRVIDPVAPLLVSTPAGRAHMMAQFYGRPWNVPADMAAGDLRAFARCPGFWPHFLATERDRFTGGRGITVPVTVAWGGRDRVLLRHQAREREELPPQTRWIELPGCGHVPMWDDPDLVSRVVLDGSRADP